MYCLIIVKHIHVLVKETTLLPYLCNLALVPEQVYDLQDIVLSDAPSLSSQWIRFTAQICSVVTIKCHSNFGMGLFCNYSLVVI